MRAPSVVVRPKPIALVIPLDQQPTEEPVLKNMLDGIRTRNPQIQSLMRYPLRHKHLKHVRAARSPDSLPRLGSKWAKNRRKMNDNREIRTPAEFLPSDF